MKAIPETPICPLKETFNNNHFYIKRDDLLPFSFGGNKARKAVLFFQDIEKKGSDCIVTYGSSSSNHCRIIANMAAARNMPCFLISPDETHKKTYNSEMMAVFGAQTTYCSVSRVKETIENTMNQLRQEGCNPYFIQGGGHGNLGTEAYVRAYDEIKNFEQNNRIHFDYIFLTSGTGTTQAGLICGKLLHKDQRQIIGISNARKNPYGGQVVLDSINDYMISIGRDAVCEDEVCFIDDYTGEGYGKANPMIIKTIKKVLINEGIPLDSTYTGKGYYGMKLYIKEKNITDKNILFIHTGGTPLFFDDIGELANAR